MIIVNFYSSFSSNLADDPAINNARYNDTIANLVDISGQSTGISFTPASANPSASGDFNASGAVGSGDASWADVPGIIGFGVGVNAGNQLSWTLGDLPQNRTVSIRCLSSHDNTGRVARWTIGSEASQDLASDGPNLTEDVIFSGVPHDGQLEITLESANASRAFGTALLILLDDDVNPAITITQSELTPGGTISGTASNFTAAPTTISLSDGVSPALTPALTATASGDDYIFSALIPDFKALADTAGEGNPVQGLRIGTITATVE